MQMVYIHSHGIGPLPTYHSVLQKHLAIWQSFADQSKYEASLAGVEWYVEAEARPPIITQSC